MSAARAKRKLDDFVSLRGAIAHRGSGASGVTKRKVRDYYDHVKYLVDRTDPVVGRAVKTVSGKDPW
jgi:hypothetical protein